MLGAACSAGIGRDLFIDCYEANTKMIDKANHKGQTPLHLACRNKLWKVKFLVDKGAKIDSIDEDGQTPIMSAAANEYHGGNMGKIIKYLLDLGADSKAKDRNGKTLLDHCKARAEKFDLTEIIDLLQKENGESVNSESTGDGKSDETVIAIDKKEDHQNNTEGNVIELKEIENGIEEQADDTGIRDDQE